MAKANHTTTNKKSIEQYDHKGKQRADNLPVALADAKSDAVEGKRTHAYDPHLDPTWGRRWTTCDTSRVALTLSKQRLMSAVFDYYQLAHPDEGVDSGLRYKTVPDVTLKSIANNEPPEPETLCDQPLVDTGKTRVTGPSTVESVPAPMVKSPGEVAGETFGVPALAGGAHDDFKRDQPVNARPTKAGTPNRAPLAADASFARSGATIRQDEWRSELLRAGIRGKGGQMIRFSRVEPFSGTRWLHADAETKPNDKGVAMLREGPAKDRQCAVISFGPGHAPLEQKQVEMALEEARKLVTIW